MERTETLLKQLKDLRNQSAHGIGFDTLLSYRGLLAWALEGYFKYSPSDFPLARNILSVLDSDELVSSVERRTILKATDFDLPSLDSAELIQLIRGLFSEHLKEFSQSWEFYSHGSINDELVRKVEPRRGASVYDPACGIGQTFVQLHLRYPNHDLKFIGQEVNPEIGFLCLVNLFVNGITNAEIVFADSIKEPYGGTADIAVSDPPFNPLRPAGRTSGTEAFVRVMLDVVGEDGVVVCRVPDSFLVVGSTKPFRESLLANDAIESVSTLPDLMHAKFPTIKSSVIVLNRNKRNRSSVIFDGYEHAEPEPESGLRFSFAREQFERTEVPISEIHDAILLPRRYALKSYKEVIERLRASSHPVVAIRDLVRRTRNGVHQRPHGRNIQDSKERERRSRQELPEKYLGELPVISAGNLSYDTGELELDLRNVSRRVLARDKRSLVDFSAIICRLNGKAPSAVYFEFANQAIVLSGDILALELDERVNPHYLLSQLLSTSTLAQLRTLRSSATLPRIFERDFLALKVILPPLDEQTRLALEFLKSRQRALQSDILEEKKEVKLAEYDVISIVVHDLNHKLSALQNDLHNLKTFFESELPSLLERPITPVFDDDTEEEVDKVRLVRVMERLIQTQSEASSQLAATREVLQNNTVNPSRTSFKKWLQTEIKPLYENEFEFVVEGEDVEFDFDSRRFADLIRNLTANASHHGAKIVVFDLAKRTDDTVRILFKNDGVPFPTDFDFETHYKGLYHRSAQSDGSGIGGYYINKIVELHNGEMHNVSPASGDIDPFHVQIEFILPVEHQKNPIYGRSNPYPSN